MPYTIRVVVSITNIRRNEIVLTMLFQSFLVCFMPGVGQRYFSISLNEIKR